MRKNAVEILIVIAIIALLCIIAIPNYVRATDRSKAHNALMNDRNIGSFQTGDAYWSLENMKHRVDARWVTRNNESHHGHVLIENDQVVIIDTTPR